MVNERKDVAIKARFDANGLIPAIAQNEAGDVLMLAYMDKEALGLTLKTRNAWYYSRERKKLWRKGQESGNTQEVLGICLDCDFDAILLTVRQKGPSCHTGEETCFGKRKFSLQRLMEEITERKAGTGSPSYTRLLLSDKKLLLSKIREESGEVIDAARKKEGKERLVWESCDLLYHLLVLLSSEGIGIPDLELELERRNREKKAPKPI